jgi:hypothetical protein
MGARTGTRRGNGKRERLAVFAATENMGVSGRRICICVLYIGVR